MMLSTESKSKSKTFVVSSIVSKLDKLTLNGEYSQQRDFTWEKIRQSNLVSDILQNNPLPELVFAEQIINGATVVWVIDGKQRCSTLKSFLENNLKIGSNVTRYMIEYSEPVKDEDGCVLRDEDGNAIYELKEFDIRKKRYKDLPDILKERFLDYAFNVVYYCNCTDEEIAYHIQRYNSGKPMNVAQKGITFIGKRNSDAIRNILSMSFFADGMGNYTESQFKNSTVSRVIAESIMTTRYPDKWNKSYDTNAKFLEQNATTDDFEYFRTIISEFEEELDYSVGKMFNDVDSFLWFGLYANFKKFGLDCSHFNKFMSELDKGVVRNRGKIDKNEPMSGICTEMVDGMTFEDVWKYRSTKDTNIVMMRIGFLTKLACEYFGVEITEDTAETAVKSENPDTKARIFVDDDIEDEDVVIEEEIVIDDEDLQNFVEEFSDDYSSKNAKIAIESLMLTTGGHNLISFKGEDLQAAADWYQSNGQQQMLDDCLSYKSFVEDAGISNDNPNTPFYVWGAKYAFDKMDADIDFDIDIADWLRDLSKTAFREIDSDIEHGFENVVTIQRKKDEIINSLQERL